ncbi:hypothetical protein ACET3Z_032024 [Daucus carota]
MAKRVSFSGAGRKADPNKLNDDQGDRYFRNHWVLIVLCNPSNDLKGGGERPTMLLLDSLKGSVSGKIEGFIRGYCSPRNIDSIPFLIPEVPNQDDDKSCGFYVLFYTTQFLKMCPHTFNLMKDYPSFMSTTWFSDEDVEELRTGLLDLFQKESSGTRKRRSDMDMMHLIDACKSAGCTRKKKKRTREVKQEEVVLEIVEEDIINDRHKLSMKHSPSLFSEMIKNLSSAQRQWISETGFGSILDFEIHTYPKYLSYGVVTKFDYESCRFVIDGRSIEISDVDVHRVLGLPLGSKTIPFVKSETPAKEWRKQYGTSKNAFRVSVKDVYMFLDSFIGRNTFSEREKPRFLPWNNYCLNKLEQILIQRSFLVDGELRAPNIDYTTLQSCRIKGSVDDDAFGRSTQNPDVEKTPMGGDVWRTMDSSDADLDWDLIPKDFPKLSEEHCDKPDQGKIPRPCFEQGNHSEWMDQVSVDSENFVNEKHRLVDSLLASYQSVQQTFLLHMLYAKESDVPDEKMESIKKSFKEMNERANSALD